MSKPATFELFGARVPCDLLGKRVDGKLAIRFMNGRIWYVAPDSEALTVATRETPQKGES